MGVVPVLLMLEGPWQFSMSQDTTFTNAQRSEEHTSELQSQSNLVCRLLLEKKNAKDIVMQDVLTLGVLFSGLVGAIAWNLLTLYLGLPSRSSRALVGSIAESAVAVHDSRVL